MSGPRRGVHEVSAPTLTYSVSMSLDGFVAGPDQGPRHPLGRRGELLHAWMRELAVWRKAAGLKGGTTNASTNVFLRDDPPTGAIILGRNMFGGGPGPWRDPPWNGWWGGTNPFHVPAFVLTHYGRRPLVCEDGTSFHFVTRGPAVALRAARKAANGKAVAIVGGGSTAREYLRSGRVTDLMIHHVPIVLGQGIRLFDGPSLARIRLRQVEVVAAPGVTHITYRVERRSSPARPT